MNQVRENFNFMKELCIDGLKLKGVWEDEWYQNQLNEELKVIFDTHLEDFFLQTAYICTLVDEAGIFRGPARGSCLASVLCYGLDITKIPPKDYNLSFSRFLNKTRAKTQLPDIDMDISSDQRDEVIDLIISTFGEDKSAQIITKLRYTTILAIKAIARQENIPFEESNRITSFLDEDEDYHTNEKVMEWLKVNKINTKDIDNLIGQLKGYGKHPGAVIIFDKDFTNYVSTVYLKGYKIIAEDGVECESMGFLKNDTLSVSVLDIQRDCLDLINDDVELPYDFDDPEVYKTICKNPMGVFQLEKAAGRKGVEMIQPSNFNELMATISLIRPGARNSGMDVLYADYKFGRKEPVYLDSRLREILNSTQGLMVFQEDLMAVARELAGMSDLETDHLRRAISKKKREAFTEFKPKFLQGCIDNNVKKEVAEKLWEDMEKSADYSFNRSHACGYAVLGYQSAWLKTYYPLEFAVAMLMHVDNEEKRVEILNMIKDSNVELCNPDINHSESKTVIYDDKVYMGLSLIDKVSDKVCSYIIEEREQNGLFTSFDDFSARVSPSKCNKSIKENMIWAGCFDNLPIVKDKKQDWQVTLI